MIQLFPTADTAAKARQALIAVGVRANVARQRHSTRVVVLGSEMDAVAAAGALRAAGFTGPANGDIVFGGPAGRLSTFAYEVR